MAKNNKTRLFHVLYADKTRVFDQSECVYDPIYIIIPAKMPGIVENPTGEKKNSCTFVLPNSDPCICKEVRAKLSA